MKSYDILSFGFSSLTQRKLRSWLTVIGIVIGIASIVALISIGEGAQARITSQLSNLGADIITVTPGFERAAGSFRGGFGGFAGSGRNVNLTEDDIRVIKSTQGVLYVNGIVSGRADLAYLGESAGANILGMDTSVWHLMETAPLGSGRLLSPGDAGSIVIGDRIANQVFKQPVEINRQVDIGGKMFRVVGIFQASGSAGQQDSAIYMSREDARQLLDLPAKKVTSVSIKVADAAQVSEIATQLEDKLKITRHVQNGRQDFTVTTAQAIQTQVSSVTSTFTLFL
ncbi:MAG: ABC transporter permease, partial [Candidatus Aenigmarchaeota archaeon]|nr:ABC transporter permease [Candidatus Aenigmarchaeota archaeon]